MPVPPHGTVQCPVLFPSVLMQLFHCHKGLKNTHQTHGSDRYVPHHTVRSSTTGEWSTTDNRYCGALPSDRADYPRADRLLKIHLAEHLPLQLECSPHPAETDQDLPMRPQNPMLHRSEYLQWSVFLCCLHKFSVCSIVHQTWTGDIYNTPLHNTVPGDSNPSHSATADGYLPPTRSMVCLQNDPSLPWTVQNHPATTDFSRRISETLRCGRYHCGNMPAAADGFFLYKDNCNQCHLPYVQNLPFCTRQLSAHPLLPVHPDW